MTSNEHFAISSRCVEAMDGRYDQHVFDAMMHHDGEGMQAKMAEAEARAAQPATGRKRLGFFGTYRCR